MKFVIEMDGKGKLEFDYRFDDPIFELSEAAHERSMSMYQSQVQGELPKCNCCQT